jgi:hypothetical protein
MLGEVVTDEQRAAALERYKAARAEAGLSPLISDEVTLRMFAAVMASARNRIAADSRLAVDNGASGESGERA